MFGDSCGTSLARSPTFPLQPSLQRCLIHNCVRSGKASRIASKEILKERPFLKCFPSCVFTFQWRNCIGRPNCKLCQSHCCFSVHLKPSFAFKFKMRRFSLPAHSCQPLREPSQARSVSFLPHTRLSPSYCTQPLRRPKKTPKTHAKC